LSFDLIISDVDGCLAPESAAPMDLENLARVAEHNRRALAAGGLPPLTVCTGRPQPFAEAICRLLANTRVPCVAENGVWLYDPGRNHYEIDPAITAAHLDAVHDAARLLAERYAERGVTQQPGKAASVTLYHPDVAVLQEIFPEVQKLLEERGWPFRVSMTWFYINCDLAHISKASGIERLLRTTTADPTRLAGIGDTLSDLPIAERVAFFACPANADPELQARADYVSPHSETAGVVDILAEIKKR
jgi:hydroxymethylpyrimidine pyrophosphatase-like HAD family hydrolase